MAFKRSRVRWARALAVRGSMFVPAWPRSIAPARYARGNGSASLATSARARRLRGAGGLGIVQAERRTATAGSGVLARGDGPARARAQDVQSVRLHLDRASERGMRADDAPRM